MQVKLQLEDETLELVLTAHSYQNGRLAIRATEDSGEAYGTITVNLPNEEIGPDEIFVKTYDANSHWVPALLQSLPDVFKDTGKVVPCGHAYAEVWKLLKPIA
jgi:hypothetical protein